MTNQHLVPCLCFPISNCFNHIDQPILYVDGSWSLLARHEIYRHYHSYVLPFPGWSCLSKSVSLCIFLLVSVILFYPEKRVFFLFVQNMTKNVRNMYFVQWKWNFQLSWSWSCPIQKYMSFQERKTNPDRHRCRVYTHHIFHYWNINHVY